MCVLAVNSCQLHPMNTGVRRHAAYPRSLGPDRAACSLKFLGYEPSEWEARWQDQAKTLQTRACATMLEDRDLVDAWMAPMNESFAAGTAAAELPAMQDDEVGVRDVVETPAVELETTFRLSSHAHYGTCRCFRTFATATAARGARCERPSSRWWARCATLQ